jgi:RNA polymerase sigma-70 factor (ECF subfamily)
VEQLRDVADAADPAGLTEEALATRAAIELIATLPPDQAEVVLLRVVLNLDVATTARVLGKRAGAVRTAAHRGLRRLSEQLRQRPAVTTVTAGTIGPERDDATAGERDGATVTAAGRLTLRDMR